MSAHHCVMLYRIVEATADSTEESETGAPERLIPAGIFKKQCIHCTFAQICTALLASGTRIGDAAGVSTDR